MADWMAFDVADYVANTLHLTTRQHGGYVLLICAAWSGKGALPGTDAALASIAKLSTREWREDGAALKAFLTRRGDEWIHERVEFEWNDAQSLIAAKSKAGKEGARRRWEGRAKAKWIADPSQTHGQTDAPLPLPLPEGSEANASGADAPLDPVKLVFDAGVRILTATGGLKEPAARSLIGMWRKKNGDDAVLAAIGSCQRSNVSEPVSWITAHFAAEGKEGRRDREIQEAIKRGLAS